MTYWYIEPEVAGSLGDRTVLAVDTHPPVVKFLHYHIEGWLGDSILESFPVFIVTQELKDAIISHGLSGVNFSDLEITVSRDVYDLNPKVSILKFSWLKPEGEACKQDFGISNDFRLVISDRALSLLKMFGITNSIIEICS